MIAYLRGKIVSSNVDYAIIDVAGVGYGVQLTIRDASSISAGQDVEVLVSEVVREQSYDLHGFLTLKDKQLFEKLLKVNGIGPRTAMALIGLDGSDALISAIANSDIKFLISAPGVGKRVAERLLIDLKDKVEEVIVTSTNRHDQRVEDALLSLGFKLNDIKSMLEGVDSAASVEEQIRQALKRKN